MAAGNPAAPTPMSVADWDEVFLVYQTGAPLTMIATKHAITVQKISAHAKRENWAPRKARTAKHNAQSKPKSKVCAKEKSNAKPTSQAQQQSTSVLMKRLTGLVARQIVEIETRIAAKSEASDHERDARTLSNLTRTLDKLVELKRGVDEDRMTKAQRMRDRKNLDGRAADEEAIRADLARRLSRLASAQTTN